MTEPNKKIIANLIKTPDGTIIQSCHVHDYVTYLDKNGFEYSVDGGLDYLKRSWSTNAPPYQELSVYEDDSHQLIRQYMRWGTRGPQGKDPLKWITLAEMTDDHIAACLRTQHQMAERFKKAMQTELNYRQALKEQNIIEKAITPKQAKTKKTTKIKNSKNNKI